ncbi:PREDICTED: uncharacterized protein LOC108527033 [Rhinopithecus bieti]|uniref:uncharacterized protein LOC108527033 n=1 Tax=Rhinopithecus bieti TaxID=61621 RepID=UPI00083C79FD|nr:PREDICTED: uncharacterized protein LOC108527033 [Rhinopithecus bieti]
MLISSCGQTPRRGRPGRCSCGKQAALPVALPHHDLPMSRESPDHVLPLLPPLLGIAPDRQGWMWTDTSCLKPEAGTQLAPDGPQLFIAWLKVRLRNQVSQALLIQQGLMVIARGLWPLELARNQQGSLLGAHLCLSPSGTLLGPHSRCFQTAPPRPVESHCPCHPEVLCTKRTSEDAQFPVDSTSDCSREWTSANVEPPPQSQDACVSVNFVIRLHHLHIFVCNEERTGCNMMGVSQIPEKEEAVLSRFFNS